jgi:F-type H+-transporting ATPase subunit a
MISAATAIVVTGLIVILSMVARVSLGSGEVAIAPSGRLSIKGIFEVLVEGLAGLAKTILGKHGRVYLPIFGSIFFYILANNLFGLLPGMAAATANINLGLAIGLFSFALYNVLGLRENGWRYLAHFAGPVWWLAPLMFPIELVSHFVRPLSLSLRLSINMTGDHTILAIFTDLTKVVVPVIFYGLGTFVSLVQAFVFTLLSMIYVMMATAHDH